MLEDVLLVKKLLAFLAYVMGYAAIPILAKTFSGALGNLIGMANDRSKGLIDRTRNSLKQRSQNRRDNRGRGRRARLQSRAGEEKNLESLNPFKAANWKAAARNRNKVRVGVGTALKRWNAGAKPELRKQLLEQPPAPKTPEEKAAADEEREKLRKEDPGNVWQKYRRHREDIREGRYADTALGRHQQGQRLVSDIAAQSVTEAIAKEHKEAAERAEHAIYAQDFGELLATAMDNTQLRSVSQAAGNKLAKSGAAEQVLKIFDEAVEQQKTMGDKAPLVEIIKNMKSSDALFEGFKEKLPWLAKGGGTEVKDGKFIIKEIPDFKFMREAETNAATAWPIAAWDHLEQKVKAYPDDKNMKATAIIGHGENRRKVEMPLDEYIFRTQGINILKSEQARRNTSPEVIRKIEDYLNEHGYLDDEGKIIENKPPGPDQDQDWRQDGGYL